MKSVESKINGKHQNDTPPRRIRRWPAFVFLGGFLIWLWRQPVMVVTGEENGRWLTSTYRLSEDVPTNPRLELLRRREKLDDVIAPGKTQFEKLVLLRRWVHSQWTYSGDPFYYPAWDGVEILDLARKIGNKGFCAQYAVLYLQACQSLGLHARYVELPGHFIVGVWSDDYDRWVLMDHRA